MMQATNHPFALFYNNYINKIPGWFSKLDATIFDIILDYQLKNRSLNNILEIGVWEGKSAALLAVYASRSKNNFIMIDPNPKEMEILSKVIYSLSWEKDQCIFLKAKSGDVSEELASRYANKYSFIHVDGDHSYGALASDLELAKILIKQDGIICIDDFFNPGYPQITACCFSFLAENPDYSIILITRNKCYICHKQSRDIYLKILKNIIELTSNRGIDCILSQTNINEIRWEPIYTITEFNYHKEWSKGAKQRGPDQFQDRSPFDTDQPD